MPYYRYWDREGLLFLKIIAPPPATGIVRRSSTILKAPRLSSLGEKIVMNS